MYRGDTEDYDLCVFGNGKRKMNRERYGYGRDAEDYFSPNFSPTFNNRSRGGSAG